MFSRSIVLLPLVLLLFSARRLLNDSTVFKSAGLPVVPLYSKYNKYSIIIMLSTVHLWNVLPTDVLLTGATPGWHTILKQTQHHVLHMTVIKLHNALSYTVYCKLFEVEKFRGFHGLVGNRETFLVK